MLGTSVFKGMMPRVSPRNLPKDAAVNAENCWLSKGFPTAIPELSAVDNAPTDQFFATLKTIFRYDGDGLSGTPYRFFQWTKNVDVVRMPVPQTSNKRVAWTGDNYPRHTNETIMGNISSLGKPISRRLGIPVPANAPDAVLVTAGFVEDATQVAESHSWVFTFVSDLEEEGPPSAPTAVLTRFFNVAGNIQSVTLTLPTAASSYPSGIGDSGVNRKRIYRTLTGESGLTSYQLVAEVTLATSSYTDSILSAALGYELISLLWDPPPAGLEGLTLMPNGVMAGFVEDDVYLSVPYQPHAWPTDYIVNVGSKVVGMGAIGVTLVVGTVENPYLISGLDPATASPARMEFQQPCASKQSFTPMDQMGVAYASDEGLVLVAPQGGLFLSKRVYDKETWQAINPSSIRAVYHDGAYIAFTSGDTIALDPENTGAIRIKDSGIKAVYQDLEQDRIWVVDATRIIKEWKTKVDANDSERSGKWKSKPFVGQGRTYSIAQVISEEYPDDGSGEIHLKIFGDDDVELADKKVFADLPFRLPATMGLHTNWSYEISGKTHILEVRIGTIRDMI